MLCIKKHFFIFVIVVFLLCACSKQFEHIPAIRASLALEENHTIIASNDDGRFTEESDSVYLYSNEPIYDVLISIVYEYIEDESVERHEVDGYLYTPELSTNQAVKIFDPYPNIISESETDYTQISYTNHAGEYEAVLLLGDKEKRTLSLSLIEPCISGKLYDDYHLNNNHYDSFGLFSEDFKEKMLTGCFDAYIPKGFCIADGSLGDVNGDGIEDALICLITDGPRVAAYTGTMPLFVLIGQPNGGYVIEKKVPDALFIPYRSSSYPVSGDGYIDIVYKYVGGAACHHTQVYRFWYVQDDNDWLLKDFTYHPTYSLDYSDIISSSFVRALPSFNNLPLERLTGNEYSSSLVDWDYFDEVCQLVVPSRGEYNDIYTFAVKLNNTAQCYEGYIYIYYESLGSGAFIQTVRGDYKLGENLVITSSDKEMEFAIQDDIWRVDEYDDHMFINIERNGSK